jgi:hypothetical protein
MCLRGRGARERGTNARERGVQVATNRLHGSNDHDRNASGNQTVFDRGGAELVLQKRCSWVLENLVII